MKTFFTLITLLQIAERERERETGFDKRFELAARTFSTGNVLNSIPMSHL